MAANKKKKPAPKSKKKQAPQQPSIRGEIAAAVLILLAFFAVLGLFWRHSVIGFLRDFGQGLLGAGFYILPVILLWTAVLLLRRKDNKVGLRIAFTCLLSLLLGALVQVFVQGEMTWGGEVVKEFYRSGVEGPAGGLLSGLLGAALCACFSKFGAAVLLIVLFALCLMAPIGMTPRTLIMAIRNRPRPEVKEPVPEQDVAERIVNRIAETRIAREKEKEQIRELKKPRKDFQVDIPVDDPPLPVLEMPDVPNEPEIPEVPAEDTAPESLIIEQRLRDREERQLTIDELPEQRVDVMPLPLINDLIAQKKKVARADAQPPEPVSAEGPFAVDEAEAPIEMPIFDPSEYIHSEETPAEPEEFEEAQEIIPEEEADGEEWEEEEDFYDPEDPWGTYQREQELQRQEELEWEREHGTPEAEETAQEEPEVVPAAPLSSAPAAEEPPAYIYPPLELLNHSAGGSIDATEEMRLNSERLADTLRSFGIQPNIVNVTRGPTVTRYELQLNPGVKLSRITNLSEDIALALGATGVRISAIPEKMSVVGIEVPNRAVSTVYARDVIDSREFSANKSKLAFAVGKDIGGNRIIGNIAKMPHLLIAGTTGSGKSVCMNSLIISLLYKASPDEVRMIMIDPKMVELGIYNNIPHLLIPVVTDPKKASGSLQWAVSEMMRRYSIMAESGAKDIFGYNKAIEGNPERKKLPQIVVVIDELADLMLVAAKEVEESICRIAQMGRASGIHLVIATQRPSANVITGLMKANIPSRIAFAVASAMESRIILDTSGAEKLVGRGDMLYAPLGEGKAKRIQGCFITDEEVHRVADFVKQRGKAEYSAEIMEHIDRKAAQNGKNGGNTVAAEPDPDDDRDELLYDAIDIILELGQASVSVLQRKLKLGYARASRIVDQMEEMGIVGAHKGSKPRDILITKEKWEAVKDGLEHLNEPVPDAID